MDLSEVEKSYEIKIGDEEHYNILQVSKTGVRVIEATCHDKVCMETGEIHDSLLPIACLPNNLIIKIEGGEENEVDTKTY
ncbi:NusG domain II-containing protein [Clostridium perfringens]|uniref:NusG domain II-containing protein n=1 Tax=Clostridium perfringens TaxID=1502 RepID=UPI001FA913E9|nr:NusG domain II-containing protein [Clostridium perfringens]